MTQGLVIPLLRVRDPLSVLCQLVARHRHLSHGLEDERSRSRGEGRQEDRAKGEGQIWHEEEQQPSLQRSTGTGSTAMSGSARREGISESARPMALPQTVRHQNHIWATLRQNRHAQVRRSQAIGLKQLAKIRERKNQVLPPKGLSQAEGPMINDGTEMSSSSSRSANSP